MCKLMFNDISLEYKFAVQRSESGTSFAPGSCRS